MREKMCLKHSMCFSTVFLHHYFECLSLNIYYFEFLFLCQVGTVFVDENLQKIMLGWAANPDPIPPYFSVYNIKIYNNLQNSYKYAMYSPRALKWGIGHSRRLNIHRVSSHWSVWWSIFSADQRARKIKNIFIGIHDLSFPNQEAFPQSIKYSPRGSLHKNVSAKSWSTILGGRCPVAEKPFKTSHSPRT